MNLPTPSSTVRPFWSDFGDRSSPGPKLTDAETRAAVREIELLRAEGHAPWWLDAVVGMGQALYLVSGLVMFATQIWVIALAAVMGVGVMLLGQKGVAERHRRYFDDPALGRTIASVLDELRGAGGRPASRLARAQAGFSTGVHYSDTDSR